MEMIELGKKYRTRDGGEVRLYAIDGTPPYKIHGAVANNDYGGDTTWTVRCWTTDGAYRQSAGSGLDLVEVLPEVTVRKYMFDSNITRVFTADTPTFANNCVGAIDITHNGKEITDVKVVK